MSARLSRRDALRLVGGGAVALVLPAVLTACTSHGPRPIAAGVDACAHCRMTITEVPLAAELVRQTGQVLTFDAVDCLADYLAAHPDEGRAATLWVARFTRPTEFLPAETARYTAATDRRGPMGGPALLAGTADDVHGGTPMTWAAVSARGGAPPGGAMHDSGNGS
ncbi:MAG: nitrous oxide reductase accessory protein NosL [Gemmatimonadaceae bacterium]|nr:nitrous oxide reductase accessory protein NosL [Gemmatimonadaceae bacterium]